MSTPQGFYNLWLYLIYLQRAVKITLDKQALTLFFIYWQQRNELSLLSIFMNNFAQ